MAHENFIARKSPISFKRFSELPTSSLKANLQSNLLQIPAIFNCTNHKKPVQDVIGENENANYINILIRQCLKFLERNF